MMLEENKEENPINSGNGKDYVIYTDGSSRLSTRMGGIGIVWTIGRKEFYTYSKGFKGITMFYQFD